MNSIERVFTVLNGEIPDRIPICLLSFQNAARYSGYKLTQYCLDPKALAEAQIAYWDEYRHDIIDIENGVATLAEAVGCEVAFSDTTDSPPWVVEPILKDLSEVDKLPEINISESTFCRALVEGTRIVARTLGKRAVIRGESDQGPFNLAILIFGVENLLLAIMEEKKHELINKLLSYCQRQIEKLVYAQMEAGSHFSMVGDSYASPDFCSPSLYKEFAFQHQKNLFMKLSSRGIDMGLHICGDTTKIVGQMVHTGARYFEIDHKVDRAVARDETLKKGITIFGAVDPGNLMVHGTREQIVQAVARDISTMGRDGCYVLCHGCTLPSNIPQENIRTFMDIGKELGVYNKDGNLAIEN